MCNSSSTPTRDKILDWLAQAVIDGNLGLFVGAGFSKAVLGERALSWGDLLKRCAEQINKEIEKINSKYKELRERYKEEGRSEGRKIRDIEEKLRLEMVDEGSPYPVVASKMEETIKEIRNFIEIQNELINKREDLIGISTIDLKQQVCNLVSIYPDIDERGRWEELLGGLDPCWFVTTNYDTLIECIMGSKVRPRKPDQYLIFNKKIKSVFHLHGVRWDKDSIVITNEDYAEALHPGDYRQQRLPSLFAEHAILMIGYDLNDLNVLTALNIGYRQFNYNNSNHFVVRAQYRRDEPSLDIEEKNGVYIIEISDIGDFLNEIKERVDSLRGKLKKVRGEEQKCLSRFEKWAGQSAIKLGDIEKIEAEIDRIAEGVMPTSSSLYGQILIYSEQIISIIDRQSGVYGAFEQYGYKLRILLALAKLVEKQQKDSGNIYEYVSFICDKLNDLAFYIGRGRGQSWAAAEIWNREKCKLPTPLLKDMKQYCNNPMNELHWVSALIQDLSD